jgi:ceramide glucosyltransferase
LRRQLRWARTTRAVRPGGYAGTILTHGLAPGAALAIVGGAPGIGAAVLWLLVRIGGVSILSRRLKLAPRDLPLLPVADLLAFALYFCGFMGRTVHWSGERMLIARKGIIRPRNGKALLTAPVIRQRD